MELIGRDRIKDNLLFWMCIPIFAILTVTGPSTCHLCRKLTTVACYTPVCFVELVVWPKATERAETCEILKDRLPEVETEVMDFREGALQLDFVPWLCWVS